MYDTLFGCGILNLVTYMLVLRSDLFTFNRFQILYFDIDNRLIAGRICVDLHNKEMLFRNLNICAPN